MNESSQDFLDEAEQADRALDLASNAAKIKRQHELDVLRFLFKEAHGRLLAALIMEYTGIIPSTLSFAADNPYVTSFNEGRRSIGIWIEDLLKDVDSQLLEQVRTEAREREEFYLSTATGSASE